MKQVESRTSSTEMVLASLDLWDIVERSEKAPSSNMNQVEGVPEAHKEGHILH